ncbi:MAG: chalcone isomerase family protein [Gammaproteobacteria bacterium]|nr:chalcone isomerase family protein [Gammaproteobacteria bacterium]HXK55588.1 chalcone isomerase family protein [Gammaproteobacteria bacterium]
MIAEACRLLLLLLALTLMPVVSASSKQTLNGDDFSLVGSGRLHWWGISIYDAALYAPAGGYRPERPHYLAITYLKDFSRKQLVDRTLAEIERLHGVRSDREAVLSELSAIFTDVSAGDRLFALHRPGEGVEFYSEERLLGRLDDATLAADFFSIWLDPDTSEPELRERLLGDLQ